MQQYEFNGFRLDAGRRLLFGPDGQSIALKPKVLDTLVHLVENAGQLLDKSALMKAVWGNVVVEENSLNQHVSTLRKALGEAPGDHRFIVTVPGRGYRFVADVSMAAVPEIDNPERETASEIAAASTWPASGKLRLVSSIGAVALLLVAVGFVVPYAWSPSSDRGLQVTPLSFETDGGEVPHVIGSTVWKPDSRAIAFSAYPRSLSGPPQPYVLYLDGFSVMPLTPRFAEGLPKQWTPQGQVMLNRSAGPNLISGHQISQSAGLWTVPAVGGEPEPVFTPPPGTTNILSITADGSTVAALRRDEQGIWGIWAGSIAGGTLERYEPVPFAPTTFANAPALSFSPDGRQLLLMWNSSLGRGPEFGEQAWLLPYPPDPERPARRILETLPAYNLTPQFSWLPDNRHIVISAAEVGRPWRLYLADTVSGRFRPLTDGTGTADQFGPVVSPDGTRFVFSEIATNLDIVTMNVRTAAVSTLIATNRNEWAPVWARDGTRFVYMTDRSGQQEIWLREEDGGNRPLVTPRNFPPGTTAFLVAPEISPDGTRVMYTRVESHGRGATGARLWMSSLAGGAPVRLRNRAAHENPGSWSPDGAWYVYEELQGDGTFALRKTRTSGTSEPETLAKGVRSESVPEWSPDGRWILFDDDGLRLIAADGGETRDLGVNDALCTFARTPETLYCIDNASGVGGRKVVVRSFDGTTQAIGSLAMEHWPVSPVSPGLRLSLTPDGDGVTYSVRSQRVQLLLADGLADVPRP
jgi:DNA-binding winged helix-turn-helix (wHTH) protein/Tol biopolymer transport system component